MENAIKRPDAPNHFMVLKQVNRKIVFRNQRGELLAESENAIRLLEAGRTLFDPVLYIPKQDVTAPMDKTQKSTFCPLKGDASYYSTADEEEIAWAYEEPLPFSTSIKDLVAFYPDRVIIEEHPID